LRFWIYIY